MRKGLYHAVAAATLLLWGASSAEAYVGPGAGFALLSSFFVLFTTLVMAALSMLLWPVRQAIRLLQRKWRAPARVKRLVIVGLDGMEPTLADRFIKEGKLPNLKRLADAGCYRRLQTTFPSVSPVAWSSFSTGTQPGRHNIFDFLDRDRKSYLPLLSSTQITPATRFLKLGRFRIPLSRPSLRLLRKSRPFWAILGDHGVWSTVLRVPITFPPDRFYGAELSAMSVPDLLGTQGTFTLYTTRSTNGRFEESGVQVSLTPRGDHITAAIQGPENGFLKGQPPMRVPLTLTVNRDGGFVRASVDGTTMDLRPGELTGWITVKFRAAPGIVVSGICRLLLTEMAEHVSIYMSPINLDPERPAMPISHPSYYAPYLAAKIGKFATLGLAEDTWALNERVIDEDAFLKQTYDVDRERQDMFFAALDRLRTGALVCVFDATDRIQHMFWRYLDPTHPAAPRKPEAEHRQAIENLYRHNDALVGRVAAKLQDGDLLMVVSDHGFSAFRRGVNLNAWLHRHGYLSLKGGADGNAEWLTQVDWSATRAYAVGLTGIFLNVKGREGSGVVEPGPEANALKAELIARLSGLGDDEKGAVAIQEVFDTTRLYTGPYVGNAPDLLVGYNAGYRCSWASARGVVSGPIVEDNCRPWSGDHCIDPRLVPGVLFCNRRIERDDPSIMDIAPTVLQLFGIDPPAYMDGRALFTSAQ
jgi:predicted AlkP superfamily phosphohydrolase/phosphomutase